MKVSYNRGAQTLVCRLAVSIGGTECDLGMAVARDIWADAGLHVLGASLIDGSGLEGNYITPENAVEIQSLMAKRPDAAGWRATLPILGVDGSLVDADLFNGRFRLGTKTLGGVMDTKDGRHLAFTVIVNQGSYAELEGVFEANEDVGKIAAAIQQVY